MFEGPGVRRKHMRLRFGPAFFKLDFFFPKKNEGWSQAPRYMPWKNRINSCQKMTNTMARFFRVSLLGILFVTVKQGYSVTSIWGASKGHLEETGIRLYYHPYIRVLNLHELGSLIF